MVRPMPQAPPAPSGSLAAALAGVPDPRRPYGWRPAYAPVPLVGLLQATVVAVLSGMRSQQAVAQWIRERAQDAPELLEALGIPLGRSTCAATLYRVYRTLDVGAFEAALGTWLVETGVAPDDPVALDGKTLRGVHGHREGGEYVPGVHRGASGGGVRARRAGGAGPGADRRQRPGARRGGAGADPRAPDGPGGDR